MNSNGGEHSVFKLLQLMIKGHHDLLTETVLNTDLQYESTNFPL